MPNQILQRVITGENLIHFLLVKERAVESPEQARDQLQPSKRVVSRHPSLLPNHIRNPTNQAFDCQQVAKRRIVVANGREETGELFAELGVEEVFREVLHVD